MEILRARDVEFDVIEYLKTPLSAAELKKVLAMLDSEPAALVRKDKNFKTLGLDAADYQTAEQVIALLVEHPKLMERPVAVKGGQAIICRPSEKVEVLLD